MNGIALQCPCCGARQKMRALVEDCSACGANANPRVTYEAPAAVRWHEVDGSGPGLWRYRRMLPTADGEIVTLNEGATPLLAAPRLGRALGVERLYIKDETRNPTWSYKDRLSTVAVSAAARLGAKVLATSSSGNAGASLAAYAARAGLPCVVFTFAGTAGPMLAQIEKYGAKVVPLARKQDRWPMLAEFVKRFGWFATSPYMAPVTGSHPLGIEGYKTLAYEICADLDGTCPDWVVMPVCYGDALAGTWYGFQELHAAGAIDRLPRMVAAEVFGSLGAALARNLDHVPDMAATFAPLAVSVGATQGSVQALQVLRESRGVAVPVGNDGLIEAQETLARHEGLFGELTAVMPVVAIEHLVRDGTIGRDDCVVGVVTAAGLKDLDKSCGSPEAAAGVPGTFDDVSRFLSDTLGFIPARAG